MAEGRGSEGRAADEAIEVAMGNGLDAGRSVGQIDVQQPARRGGERMGLEVVSHRRGHLRFVPRRYVSLVAIGGAETDGEILMRGRWRK